MKYIVVSLVLSYISGILCVYSGIYVSNGKDQTILAQTLSEREKELFAREMLDVLGLPENPRKPKNSNLTNSAPKFLIDIYKSLLTGARPINEFNLKAEDLRFVKQSDEIMTFIANRDHVNDVRHEKGARLYFDVKDVPLENNINGAELRLYKLPSNEPGKYTITIYQVILEFSGKMEMEYTDALNVTHDYEGWLVFNLTSAFKSWIDFPYANRGLFISVHRSHRPGHAIHPEVAGIVSSLSNAMKDHFPFVVAFLEYGSGQRRRFRRDTNIRKKKSEDDVSYNANPLINPESNYQVRNCQIQTLYVNFRDLNWQDWIIAPDGYAAFYCGGLCDFPLNAHMNATNHAIVQTLVHLINPQAAPKACCAPTKLGSIAVLYYLEDNNVILKKYKNMVVKSCGCH